MIDLAIVGGGLVGLATAFRFLGRFSGRRVVLLEKERAPETHQSGHNSGVLHSGLYHAPGSRKALLCRRGKALLLPELEESWLEPAPAGVRAQALDRSGRLVDDFACERRGAQLHVLCAPSPAATACLAIADHLIDELGA